MKQMLRTCIKLINSKDLEKATNNFNKNKILGQREQGVVYKGMLAKGRIVAVKKSKQRPLLPSPTPWPIIGNLPKLWRNKPTFRWIHGLMKELNTEIACVRLGGVHVIPVTSPEIAREFLTQYDSIFASRPLTIATEYSTRGFKAIALVPWTDHWKKMRKVVASNVINPTTLHWLLHKRAEEADNLVRNDGGPGVEEVEHVESLWSLLTHIYAFAVSNYIPCLKALDLDGHGKMVSEAMRIVSSYKEPIIDERVEMWRDGKKKEAEDLLNALILAKDSNGEPTLSVEEIKAQITANEIDRVVGKERWVQESEIPKLNYVKACAREGYRLHPVAPCNLPYVSMQDMTVAGYFIPKWSHVLISRYGLGRNPRVWEEPLKFKPERHLIKKDESSANCKEINLIENELRFISFSTGRRGCMGIQLGTSMNVMLLARLLQGFSWSFPPNMEEIDLSESVNHLLKAKPLHACAKPLSPPYQFQTPTKIIQSPDDIRHLHDSDSDKNFLGFVVALSESIRGHKISNPCHVSQTMNSIVSILETLIPWIDKIPPLQQPSRYDNLFYRTWQEHLIEMSESLMLNNLGLLVLLVGGWGSYKVVKKRKGIKQENKFFKRNGGLLLQQQLSSHEANVENIKLFNSKDLEKATDRFNVNRILGQGGQGTVYNGMLANERVVAVKKSKVIDEGKLKVFINEIVILSQINHRNAVKLIDCCLETEVPLLVYEYVPNGTLFQYVNSQTEEFSLFTNMGYALSNSNRSCRSSLLLTLSSFHPHLPSGH
ncbi:hypothetical protein FH972_014845 [Carpinus fangiana]|uniref:Protein kinase domain-containing protein n=1 Tax=Carpinus fangiana TaxID=176857 RepID=A0A5N6REK8_9ROSI|nr:hypothetical protein FH972_014845 [Carpinus fangiana]